MIIVFQPSRAALSPVVFQNPAQLNSRDHGKQGARRRLQTEMLHECNTCGQYTSVLITFERVDEALPPPAVSWLGLRFTVRPMLRESRHASLRSASPGRE